MMKQIFLLILCVNFNSYTLNWKDLVDQKEIFLYPGDVPSNGFYDRYIGLSLSKNNRNHIKHDVTNSFLLPDNTVDAVQSEDVFEHIEYKKLVKVINEIYRVLKPGGYFRLSMPDYGCDILYERSLKDCHGEIIFDAGGGGKFINGKVVEGGHLWFPTYQKVKKILKKTNFYKEGKIEFLHYYEKKGRSVTHDIDYSKGFVMRTPDHDERVRNPYRAMSIVVDMYKKINKEN